MAKYIDAKETKRIIRANDWSNKAVSLAVGMIIDRIPAADVVEVKHGKWIEQGDGLYTYYDCSVCGEAFVFIDGEPTENLYQYCPNCGAKMDGERKEK